MNNSIVIKDVCKNEVCKTEYAQLVIKIKYPHFSCENDNSKKLSKLCKNMNEYYTKTAEALYQKAKKILTDKQKPKKTDIIEKNVIEMNYKTALKNNNFISIVVDISFEGERGVRKKRFSQNWSINDALIVPPCFLLKMTYGTRKKVCSFVLEKANSNAKNNAFGYYSDFSSRLKHSFSLKRFFITENGFAFYFDAGILSDVKHGSFAFVVPYEELASNIKTCVKNTLCPEKKGTQIENN